MTHTVTVVIPMGWMLGLAFWVGCVFAVIGVIALDLRAQHTEQG